jgi:hypothetical protein
MLGQADAVLIKKGVATFVFVFVDNMQRNWMEANQMFIFDFFSPLVFYYRVSHGAIWYHY